MPGEKGGGQKGEKWIKSTIGWISPHEEKAKIRLTTRIGERGSCLSSPCLDVMEI